MSIKSFIKEDFGKNLIFSIVILLIDIPATWTFNRIMDCTLEKKQEDISCSLETLVRTVPPSISNIRLIIVTIENGTAYWKGNRLLSNEIIPDQEGYYCIIDLKNASAKKTIFFGPGEYVINTFDSEFSPAINDFNRNILQELIRLRLKYKIYIKGSADITGHRSFSKDQVMDYRFDTVDFFTNIDGRGEKYSSKSKSTPLPFNYRNSNLPNLRAIFLKTKLETHFPEFGKITILDGLVDKYPGHMYRNACIILFIDIPPNKLREIFNVNLNDNND